jgi:hypothetical protein
MLMGFVVLPMIIIGKDTWLGYFGFVKYIYPYYDLTSLMINQGMKDVNDIQKIVGNETIGDNGGPYIYYTIGIYAIMLILIEMRIF